MIECHFNERGYSILGGGFDIVRSLKRKFNGAGEAVLEDTQNQYAILLAMLSELVDKPLSYASIRVIGDSRVIDECNGARPIDDLCDSVLTHLMQQILPRIDGQLLFTKMEPSKLDDILVKRQAVLTAASPPQPARKKTALDKFRRRLRDYKGVE